MLSGMNGRPTTQTLGVLLARQAHEAARQAYGLQMLWQIGAQLFAMAGGGEYPMADYFTLFPPAGAGGGMNAEEVRRRLLRLLEEEGADGECV